MYYLDHNIYDLNDLDHHLYNLHYIVDMDLYDYIDCNLSVVCKLLSPKTKKSSKVKGVDRWCSFVS